MRILIDLQAAQSPDSRHRGIGRYSIALAKAMLRNRGDHEILIALNGMFADTIAPLRETFSALVAVDDIHVWHATVPPLAMAHAPAAQRQAAERVREAFLASLKPDIVHVSSIFESSGYAVTSVHGQADGPLTAVTLYDLIPHIYPEIYLDTPQAERNYQEKIGHLRLADLWLAISESSRREGIERLHLPAAQVVNISSAADAHFTPGVVAAEREADLRERYGLPRPFVMYTGGIDHRKNIEGLIRAWAALPAEVRLTHQLAVVCSVQAKDRLRLEQLMLGCYLMPADVVLTGFVPEAELVDLYRLCKLFVFPSQHEGFGLPALEAMSCGAPVIGADNSSIPEVIGRADALFDAGSEASITAKILECLQSDALRTSLVSHGRLQARLFDWDTSARAALAAFERAVQAGRPARPAPAARLRLAFVSPMPPQRSGIADYSAQLLSALAEHYEIDLILDQPVLELPEQAPYGTQRTAAWFLQHGHAYDRVLYQFGNSTYHEYMFPLLERHPGTVVLHDFYLSGLLAHRELHGATGPHWSRALYESHGWPALVQRFHAASLADVVYAWPANFEVLRQAAGVIVHSEHALRLGKQWYGPDVTDEWALIPLLRLPAPAAQRAAARARLRLAPEDFIVCSFGQLGPTKLNHRLLSAWRESALAAAPGCRLLFVGEQQRGEYGKAFAQELGWHSRSVRVTGWTGNDAYRDYLDAADMAVQLRTLSRGETSAAVLDCMNHGLPTIANREGSMADLDPDAVCLLAQEFSDSDLAAALEALWRDPARRAAMEVRARGIVHTLHQPAACAAAYAQAIEAFARRAATGIAPLVRELGQIVPADADDSLLAGLARAIAQNMPEKRAGRQLLVDISGWVQDPACASALPALLQGLIGQPPDDWRPEPVYQTPAGDWRYARRHTLRALGCQDHVLEDDPVDLQPGDLWCLLPADEERTAPPPPRVAELGLVTFRLPAQGNAVLVWAALSATAGAGRRRQWFIDISELVQRDWQSGIQRVVKNYLLELLLNPPPGTCVIPVYATDEKPGYRVAQRYVLELAGIETPQSQGPSLGLAGIETPQSQGPSIEPRAGDLFFGLDLQPHIVPVQAAYLAGLRARGVRLAFMVYDLLPIRLPDCFAAGGATDHARWLRVVANADLAVCISQAVADDLAAWLRANPGPADRQPALQIRAVHLGANLTHTLPTHGLPACADQVLAQIGQRPSFLMVGTIEPRKSHAQVLEAFERLWAQGHDVNLVIAGRPGWMLEPLLERLRAHPQRDERLFWIEDSSDEYLEQIYQASACLIAASRGEGFGLPLIEAAQHSLPIIARDLPVFREVAGEHACYFQDDSPGALADVVLQWQALRSRGSHPRSKGMTWLTWAQSAGQLKQLLLEDERPSADAGFNAEPHMLSF